VLGALGAGLSQPSGWAVTGSTTSDNLAYPSDNLAYPSDNPLYPPDNQPYRSRYQNEPPVNPFLADSPWPMSHRNPYNQASSPHPGPTTNTEAYPQFLSGEAVPITLAFSNPYADGRRVMWGNTLQHVFKVGGEDLKYRAKMPRRQKRDDAISGAYAILDKDGRYFVPRGVHIEAYVDAIPHQADSPIRQALVFELPESLQVDHDDMIVGINMTYDGRIVFVTRRGLIGSLSRDLDDFTYLRIGDSSTEISNSIAVDETGGIFVVTSEDMNRVQWQSESRQRLSLEWSTPYLGDRTRRPGRLGVGSGTTPTLVGVGDQDRFVVIGDGQDLMHMVLIWRDEIPADWPGLPGRDRRIAAEVPVTFGDPDAERSTTEQSITVRGHEMVVVSNLYGELRPIARRMFKRLAGLDIHLATIYRSNNARIAPYGIEKFTWNPRTRQLTSSWANRSISCPNGIPTMSEATGLCYLIGQRDSSWTLEAVSWETGESAFHQKLSRDSDNNSFYAATEIGPGGSILTGTYSGILEFGSTP